MNLATEYKLTADNAQTSEESWRSQLQIAEDNLAMARLELNSLKQKYVDLQKIFTAEQEKSQGSMFDLQELTVKLETSKSEMNEFLSRISELQQTLLSEEQRYKALEAVNNNLCLQLEEMKLAKDQLVANKVIDQPLNSHSLDRKSPFNNEVASIPKTFQFQSDMVNQASMEYFQSHLHLREGECAHLKREIEQLTATQEKLLTEVAKQTARAEKYEKLAGVKYTNHVNRTLSQSDPFAPTTNNYRNHNIGDVIDDNDPTMELQQRYETLLILCGKLTEENNELKLDLADVKEMYRAQIDMLLKSQ
uniref:TATA element modulatory factor n=1 Tax=Schistosoma haematobium TaxID=6185 RepID=A0A094ZPV3_SCHHA